MQILRQALLEKLSTPIILFKVLRNKILCLTQFQLILLSIDSVCKKIQIPYTGANVWAIQMSKDYIAILQRSGNLQIRRLDNIKQVILTQRNVKISNSKYPKLKWWQDDLHVIYQKRYDEINILTKQLTSQIPPFDIHKTENLIQLQFCDLFHGLKSIFYVLNNSIHLCLNGFKLGLIEFQDQQIKQVLRLCHPLQQIEFNKQYLAILTQSVSENSKGKQTYLKIYNILNMKLIFSKELIKQKDQQIEILTDQLCEYLLIKYYKGKVSNSSSIQSQNLLKVNGQYYYSSDKNYFEQNQSFFMFDIEIGLKKDLRIFPSHSERIKGKLCNSIDTCYFQQNQIFIASVVLEASYKDQIFKVYKQIQMVNQCDLNIINSGNQSQIIIWKQIVEAKINPKIFVDKIVRKIGLKTANKVEKQSSFSIDIGIQHQRIIQDLLSSLTKINKFSSNDFNKAYQTIKKIIAIQYFPMLMDVASIEKDQNKIARQILEKSNEDFSNTMSGFSSSIPHSPRSANSSQHRKEQDKLLFKDSSKELSRTGPAIEEDQDHCHQCAGIEDHQNLQLIASIVNKSAEKAKQSLTKLQEQLFKIESLCKYRLQKMEIKTKRQKRTQINVCSLIENQFHTSLYTIQQNVLNSAKRFTQKLAQRTKPVIQKQLKKSQFIQKIEDKTLTYDNQFKIHKDSKDELLDYLYDIQFPQVGMQTYQPTSFASPFNKSELSNSLSKSVNKSISGMNMGINGGNEQFKLFSEYLLKNFI